MAENSATQAAYDEVLKKIGRNLLSFQIAEQLLKELLKLGGFATQAGQLDESFRSMAERVDKMTLGGLSTLFTDKHCSKKEAARPDIPKECKNVQISMNFSLGYDQATLEERHKSLANLVEERNRLVHHLLLEFDRDSEESCRATAANLDRQRELVLPEIKRLQEEYRLIHQRLSDLVAFMSSPDGLALLAHSTIQDHPLIQEFMDIAQKHPDPDEWAPLNSAAKSISSFGSKEISEICESFGCKSLTELMIASQLFDIQLEPTGMDRHRVLYRLKQGPSCLLLKRPPLATEPLPLKN